MNIHHHIKTLYYQHVKIYFGVAGKIKRREVELDPQVSPAEIMSRELELGCESWTSFASSYSSTAVQQTLSMWLCPARQLKRQLYSALVTVQWRRNTTLTLPLFWQRSTVSPVFFGWYPQLSLHTPPPPPHPVPNKPPRFCGCKAKCTTCRKERETQYGSPSC